MKSYAHTLDNLGYLLVEILLHSNIYIVLHCDRLHVGRESHDIWHGWALVLMHQDVVIKRCTCIQHQDTIGTVTWRNGITVAWHTSRRPCVSFCQATLH